MATVEQKEAHRQQRAQVREAVEANQTQCGHYGNPTFYCCYPFNNGVEKPCFDACYRLFMEKLFGTQGTKS